MCCGGLSAVCVLVCWCSPGGSVSAGMAIYDAMQFVPCDVATVCFGMAASMGAFLLGAGAPVRRHIES